MASEIENERLNFIRLVFLYCHVCNNKLREYFKLQWPIVYERANPGSTPHPWTDKPKDATEMKKVERKLKLKGNEQKKFDTGNTNEWDFTLLTSVLRYSSLEFVIPSSPECKALDDLKGIRNKFIGHPSDARLSYKDFKAAFQMTYKALGRLCNTTKEELTAVKDGPYSVLNSLEVLGVTQSNNVINEIPAYIRLWTTIMMHGFPVARVADTKSPYSLAKDFVKERESHNNYIDNYWLTSPMKISEEDNHFWNKEGIEKDGLDMSASSMVGTSILAIQLTDKKNLPTFLNMKRYFENAFEAVTKVNTQLVAIHLGGKDSPYNDLKAHRIQHPQQEILHLLISWEEKALSEIDSDNHLYLIVKVLPEKKRMWCFLINYIYNKMENKLDAVVNLMKKAIGILKKISEILQLFIVSMRKYCFSKQINPRALVQNIQHCSWIKDMSIQISKYCDMMIKSLGKIGRNKFNQCETETNTSVDLNHDDSQVQLHRSIKRCMEEAQGFINLAIENLKTSTSLVKQNGCHVSTLDSLLHEAENITSASMSLKKELEQMKNSNYLSNLS